MKQTTLVVLDTNVYVSALLNPFGKPGRLISNIFSPVQVYMPVLTPEICHELRTTLCYPKIKKLVKMEENDIERWILALCSFGYELIPKHIYPTLIQEDPKDDRFLIAAIESGSSLIVSGDKHLLSKHPFEGILIYTPAEALTYLDLS